MQNKLIFWGGIILFLILTVGSIFYFYSNSKPLILDNYGEFDAIIKANLQALHLNNNTPVVAITSSGFNPNKVTIKAGKEIESVMWMNQDSIPHSVNYTVIGAGGVLIKSFDSGPIAPGTFFVDNFNYRYKIDDSYYRGTIDYYDSLQPKNKGVIIVE